MEIQVFSESEALPFEGFRYCLVIGNSVELTSTLIFDTWFDALLGAIEEYTQDWQPYLGAADDDHIN